MYLLGLVEEQELLESHQDEFDRRCERDASGEERETVRPVDRRLAANGYAGECTWGRGRWVGTAPGAKRHIFAC